MILSDIISENEFSSSIEAINMFFNEMVRLKIYEDKHLVNLREFRIYIAKKSVGYQGVVSEDIKNDLYYFLEFDRFDTDDYIKDAADLVLDDICARIAD